SASWNLPVFAAAGKKSEIPAFAGMTLSANQFPPDQHPPYLVRSGADIEQLGVPEIALHRPVLGVAGAAKRLDRLARHAHRILARVEDRPGGVEARRLARVAGPRHLVD